MRSHSTCRRKGTRLQFMVTSYSYKMRRRGNRCQGYWHYEQKWPISFLVSAGIAEEVTGTDDEVTKNRALFGCMYENSSNATVCMVQ